MPKMPSKGMRKGFPKGDKCLEQSAKFYDRFYTDESRYASSWHKSEHKVVTHYPALVLADPPILEVGCGAGMFAQMCQVFGVEYAIGYDFSANAVALAKEHNPGVHFRRADARSLRIKRNSSKYETVVILEVLEHIYEDIDALARVPKGKVVVGSVPNFHSEGHVRWFASADQVVERYEEVLEFSDMLWIPGANTKNRWCVFKGIRI